MFTSQNTVNLFNPAGVNMVGAYQVPGVTTTTTTTTTHIPFGANMQQQEYYGNMAQQIQIHANLQHIQAMHAMHGSNPGTGNRE